MPHAQINRVPIYFEQSGCGPEHVVFIHGMGLSHTNWLEQVPHFSTKAKVVTYDLRGHGRSGSSLSEEHPADYIGLLAEDLRLLFDHLNIKDAMLVGYSSGTLIALEYMFRYPEKVWGAVLSGAFAKISNAFLYTKLFGSFCLGQMHMTKWLAKQVAISNGATEEQIHLFQYEANKVRWNEAKLLLKSSMSFNMLDRLSQIHKPTLLLYGGNERHMMEYRHQMLTKLPETEVCLIPKVNHACPTKGKEAFNLLLDDFFEMHRPSHALTTLDANQDEGYPKQNPNDFAEGYFVGYANKPDRSRGNQNQWPH